MCKKLIYSSEFLLGRNKKNCDFEIDHYSVSRIHLGIKVVDNIVYLNDKLSSNGTFINGVIIETNKAIKFDSFEDNITLGNCERLIKIIPPNYIFKRENDSTSDITIKIENPNISNPVVENQFNKYAFKDKNAVKKCSEISNIVNKKIQKHLDYNEEPIYEPIEKKFIRKNNEGKKENFTNVNFENFLKNNNKNQDNYKSFLNNKTDRNIFEENLRNSSVKRSVSKSNSNDRIISNKNKNKESDYYNYNFSNNGNSRNRNRDYNDELNSFKYKDYYNKSKSKSILGKYKIADNWNSDTEHSTDNNFDKYISNQNQNNINKYNSHDELNNDENDIFKIEKNQNLNRIKNTLKVKSKKIEIEELKKKLKLKKELYINEKNNSYNKIDINCTSSSGTINQSCILKLDINENIKAEFFDDTKISKYNSKLDINSENNSIDSTNPTYSNNSNDKQNHAYINTFKDINNDDDFNNCKQIQKNIISINNDKINILKEKLVKVEKNKNDMKNDTINKILNLKALIKPKEKNEI